MDKSYFVEKTLQLGADHAVAFNIKDIEFDPRTIIKCMFGCSDWGKGHTCPSRPGSLMPWEYREIFRSIPGASSYIQKAKRRARIYPSK